MDDDTAHLNRWVAEHSPAHALAIVARKAGLDRQQVRLLQRAGEDAQDLQDIIDYVKFQATRVAAFRRDLLAQRLLDSLAVTLADATTAFSDRAILPLSIARLFLRQFALSYMYSIIIDNGRPDGVERSSIAPEALTPGKEASSRPVRRQGRRSLRYREVTTADAGVAAAAEEPSALASPFEAQSITAEITEPEVRDTDTSTMEEMQRAESASPTSNVVSPPVRDVPEEEQGE